MKKEKCISIKGRVEVTPFTFMQYLEGEVSGHPNFKDGEYIRVPEVVWDGDVEAWKSNSGRYYRMEE